MCYASICYVASYAETGSDFQPFEQGRVLCDSVQSQRARAAVERLPRLLERLTEVLQRTPGICNCESSMQHHIASGQIGWDWRTWFEEQKPEPSGEPEERDQAREDYEYFLHSGRRHPPADPDEIDELDSSGEDTTPP